MGRRRKPKLYPGLTITGIADKGKGVARDPEGRVIFVEDVAPGDVVDVLVYKKKKSFFLGKVTNYQRYSSDRVSPFCKHFTICGGCKWQHLAYEAQLKHKQEVVRSALERIGKLSGVALLPIQGVTGPTTYYRNKLEYSFSNKRWLTRDEIAEGVSNLENVLGFHRAGAFDKIIDIEKCWLQPDPSNDIRNTVRRLAAEQELSFYDAKAHTGFLRNMVIRVTSVGEIMLVFSFSENNKTAIEGLLDALILRFPKITSLYYCINNKQNDYLLDLPMLLYHGNSVVEERLGHVRFHIGPKSFFQTNTTQAKVLYDTVAEFAELTGEENVYDLYTGIGSIALYLAKYCKRVIGIEEIEDAIGDARKNAALNAIDNAVFYTADVKDLLSDAFVKEHGSADLLITDPPRAGMHPKVVKMLLQLEVPKMVYVSCNPATQARDLELLQQRYSVAKVRPVDMFPHTHHIESVALLKLR